MIGPVGGWVGWWVDGWFGGWMKRREWIGKKTNNFNDKKRVKFTIHTSISIVNVLNPCYE